MRIPVAVLATLVLLPITARAQYATPYGPVLGSEVRVTPRDSALARYTGRLRAFAGDSLVMDVARSGASLRLPVAALRSVEVNDGPDRAGAAFKYGGVGFLAGGIVGTAAGSDSIEKLAGCIVGMAMGLAGGVVGGLLFAPDHWRTVWTP